MEFKKMYSDMQDSLERIQEEDIGVPFGSKEYDNAKKSCKAVTDSWKDISDKGSDYEMSDYELQRQLQQLEEASRDINTYLDKKTAELKNGRQPSNTTYYRMEAMREAQQNLKAQIETLDEMAAQRGIERPLPSNEKLQSQRESLSAELQAADQNVFNGSEEFKNAREDFDRLNTLWSKTMEHKNDDQLPTAGEIQTLKQNVEHARQTVDKYLAKKDGIENPDPKTQKRITAMSRVRENLDIQEKKLAEWEAKITKDEPERTNLSLANDTTYLLNQMEEADKGVLGGSAEFKEVNDLLKKQDKKWKEVTAKGLDYKMSSSELREIEDLNTRMEKAADKYIADKAGKDLSAKTQKRLRVMQKVKDHALSQRRKIEARRDEMDRELKGVSMKDVEKSGRDISKGLRSADRKGRRRGNRDYQKAVQAYNQALDGWDDLKKKEANKTLKDLDRKLESESVKSGIKAIDKYLNSQKGKDLSKDPGDKWRVEFMEKAKKNLEIRARKLEQAADKQREAQQKWKEQRNQERNKQLKEREKNLQMSMKSRNAMERNAARASLAATSQLNDLGQRQSLTSREKQISRRALATLVLEEKLKAPGNDALKRKAAKGGKEYAKMVKQIADSKEFRQTFPDRVFTPNNCKNLASDSKVVQRCTAEFDRHMMGQAQARREMQTQRQKQNQRQAGNKERTQYFK